MQIEQHDDDGHERSASGRRKKKGKRKKGKGKGKRKGKSRRKHRRKHRRHKERDTTAMPTVTEEEPLEDGDEQHMTGEDAGVHII